MRWLRDNEASLGALPSPSLTPVSQLSKRNKWRETPSPDAATLALADYQGARGLMASPLENDPGLMPTARMVSETPLSSARIYDVLDDAFWEMRSHDLRGREAISGQDPSGLDALAASRLPFTRGRQGCAS